MENDVLKNKMAPWQEKGRWYHAHITNFEIDFDNTDDYLSNHLILDTEYSRSKLLNGGKIVSVKVIFNGYELNTSSIGSAFCSDFHILLYPDGCTGVNLPIDRNYFVSNDFDLYLFIR